jgi:aspartyl-tRNA(Asn)/glutamyl-tRNA(Gln) amidotransferase subunit A
MRAAQQLGHNERDVPARAALNAFDRHAALNAIVAKRPQALDEAGSARGLLGGSPIVVKDCFVDQGRVPTLGSHLPARWMTGTAEIIDRLRAAGAVVVGYANLHEWMVGTTSLVSAFGAVVNPCDSSLIAGGSSGGSAAIVAAGAVPFAIGTDAGGSIRIPAACCGIVGLKPTWGLVPTEGFADHGSVIDHIGPMATNVGDVYKLLEVLAGRDVMLPEAGSLRVGVARRFFFDQAHPEIANVVLGAIDGIRRHVRSIEDVAIDGVNEARRAIGPFILRDVATLLRADRKDWREHLQPQTQLDVDAGARMTESDRIEAERTRERIRRGWDEAFERVDVIVTPTLPSRIARVEDKTVALAERTEPVDKAYVAWNAPMNLAGLPCLSIPCGQLADGQPVGLSVTARAGHDGDALSLGRSLESL